MNKLYIHPDIHHPVSGSDFIYGLETPKPAVLTITINEPKLHDDQCAETSKLFTTTSLLPTIHNECFRFNESDLNMFIEYLRKRILLLRDFFVSTGLLKGIP